MTNHQRARLALARVAWRYQDKHKGWNYHHPSLQRQRERLERQLVGDVAVLLAAGIVVFGLL